MNYSYTVNASDKSKKTTLLLCIFLGFLGVHYFYVGKPGRGFLFMFTFGLMGFGWIIDIFTILNGTFKDGNGAPVKITPKRLMQESPRPYEPQPTPNQQELPRYYESQPAAIQTDIPIKIKKSPKAKLAIETPVLIEQKKEMSDGKLIAIIVGIFIFSLFFFLVVIPSL